MGSSVMCLVPSPHQGGQLPQVKELMPEVLKNPEIELTQLGNYLINR